MRSIFVLAVSPPSPHKISNESTNAGSFHQSPNILLARHFLHMRNRSYHNAAIAWHQRAYRRLKYKTKYCPLQVVKQLSTTDLLSGEVSQEHP
jgi:hypothetical protein